MARLAGELAHQRVHVLQLLQRRPVRVAAPPVGIRVEPHRERLREVLVRVALRVPAVEVQDEALAVGLRRVVVGILHVRRAEELLAPPPLTQLVGVVDGVSRLVPQDLQAPRVGAPLDLEHLRAFELLEPRMREVERDRHTRHAVGREPFRGQPEVRLKGEAARVELALQLCDSWLERAALDRHAELGDAQIEQLLVGPGRPLIRRNDAEAGGPGTVVPMTVIRGASRSSP